MVQTEDKAEPKAEAELKAEPVDKAESASRIKPPQVVLDWKLADFGLLDFPNLLPGKLTKEVQESSQSEVLQYEHDGLLNQQLKHEVKQLEQNIAERKRYAFRIFCLICSWLGATGVLVFLIGFGLMKLSDSVIITIVTTTTANVLGIMYFVAKYLFKVQK